MESLPSPNSWSANIRKSLRSSYKLQKLRFLEVGIPVLSLEPAYLIEGNKSYGMAILSTQEGFGKEQPKHIE